MQKDIIVFILLPDREQNERQCDRVYCVGPMVKYHTNSNWAHTVRTFLIGWVLSLNSVLFRKFKTSWHDFFFICMIGNSEKYLIRVAMREWEKYTCLRFRKRQSENNYIMFQDNFGWAQKLYTRDVLKTKGNEKLSLFYNVLTSAVIPSWAWSVEGSLWI